MHQCVARKLVIALLALVTLLTLGGRSWAGTRPFKELAFFAIAVLTAARFLWQRGRSHAVSIRHWSVDMPLAVFLCWAALSAVIPPRRWAAVEPFLTLVLLAVTFAVVRGAFLKATHLMRATAVICALGAFTAAGGLVQYANAWPESSLLLRVHPSGRISSTMGNPNLLASLLCATLFVSLGLLVSGMAVRRRAVVAAGMTVTLAALVLAMSRGAVIGLAAGLVVFVLLWRSWLSDVSGEAASRIVLAAVALVLLAGASIMAVRVTAAQDIKRPVDPTRLFIWRGALRMFASAPLTGYGIGRFGIAFPTFHYGEHEDPDFPFDAEHAHSEPLETAAELGVTGLLLVAWVLGSLVLIIRRVPAPSDGRARRRLAIAAGCIAAVAAILGQSLVCVNTRWIQVSCPLAVMAGLALAALAPYADSRSIRRITLSTTASRVARGVIASAVLAFALVFPYAAYRVVRADIAYRSARVMMPPPGVSEGWKGTLSTAAIRRLEDSVSFNPYRVDAWYALGALRLMAEDYAGSLEAYDKVCALVPDYQRAHLMRGQVLLACGRSGEAVQEFRRDQALYRRSALGGRLLKQTLQQRGATDKDMIE